jgi:CheY-like chemotaxis protein/HPt (histidine-containing phosphotransfer) domain-containing protein
MHQTGSWKMRNAAVSSGAEGLELLRSGAAARDSFDVVILDLQMPEMDGLTLAQTIRADAALQQPRLVLLTSLGLRLDADAWRSAGIDAYLVKPVKRSRLHDCLSALVAEDRADAPGHDAEHAPGFKGRGRGATPNQLRILMAEDNLVNQKVALRQLKKLGYSADAVSNGVEVIEGLKKIPYNVVLMDCHMPELDGYEATRLIRQFEAERADPHRPPAYIIAMTANALQGDRDQCLAAGMNDYISKPVKLPELQAVLQQAAGIIRPTSALPASPRESAASDSTIDTSVLAGLRELREPDEPDDPVAELIDLFLRDTPARVRSMESAIRQSDAPALRDAAHSLKGSSNNLGARRLSKLCADLEHLAKDAKLGDAARLFGKAAEEYERVRFVLEKEKKK